MARYWCCNFDADAGIEILRHGLQINTNDAVPVRTQRL